MGRLIDADAWRGLLGADLQEAAVGILGATLTSTVSGRTVSLRITEVEAYAGLEDPASHAYRGRTPRTEVMFGPAGRLYCYFVYGMHWCANITCGPDGLASAVLLRGAAVIAGTDVASERSPARSGGSALAALARGPAKLARCLGLDGSFTGTDLLDADAAVHLEGAPVPTAFSAGPRVGVSVAADRAWRYWIPGEPSVSAYRRGSRRRDTSGGSAPAAGR